LAITSLQELLSIVRSMVDEAELFEKPIVPCPLRLDTERF
jgi:hypothetical protein